MDHPTEVTLQDVRCFEGEQRGRLRPITLLVGENSTGKTTFLGCYRALSLLFSEYGFMGESPDFNVEPFAMGSFRDIARSRRGPSGRISEFKLALKFEAKQSASVYRELTATFGVEVSQPVVLSLHFRLANELSFELRRGPDNRTVLEVPDRTLATDFPFDNALSSLVLAADFERYSNDTIDVHSNLGMMIKMIRDTSARNSRRRDNSRKRSSYFALPFLPELVPVAPLRAKPKRTYDPVRETASPEGEHVPMLMMRLDHMDKAHWNSLRDNLVDFGKSSGLFSDIKVKRHGKQMSDPFQLQVKVRSGPNANIMDVGYGVSQSLPILVDIMAARGSSPMTRRRTREQTFMLQQPEVHLHPRGQAELASLFIAAFKERSNRFLIETHSDYIVDRVRISVRQGVLKPDDVAILYFEPKGNAVKIHSMGLDEAGNLEDAPAGYREFFLKETDKLLGFAD